MESVQKLKGFLFVLPGIRGTPRSTASRTALMLTPKTVRPPLIPVSLSCFGRTWIRGGLEFGRLAYLDGITVNGRVLG